MTIDYEKIHKEFDGMIFNLCSECGGKCEFDTLSPLLPKEEEYISKKLGINTEEFIKKFCHSITFKQYKIYILKNNPCPFLDKDKRCKLEKQNCKVIDCLLYPILIENKRRIFVDTKDCPMANKLPKEFKEKAIAIYEEIKDKIPDFWLEFRTKFLNETYNEKKMEDLRKKSVITIEDLKKSIIS